MKLTTIGGVEVAYETVGSGPLVIYTPSGLGTIEQARPVAEAFANEGFCALVYDRINTGHSGFDFTAVDLRVAWADQMHGLIDLIGSGPAIVGGASNGLSTSLYFAHRYPDQVRGMYCISPGRLDPGLAEYVTELTYLEPSQAMARRGIAALIEEGAGLFEWHRSPAPRKEELAKTDPAAIRAALKRWSSWPQRVNWTYGGLTDKQLGELDVPAIVFCGIDDIHTAEAGERLHGLLPDSQYVDMRSEYGAGLNEIRDQVAGHGAEYFDAELVPRIVSFMRESLGINSAPIEMSPRDD